ncbi:MAG TPA: hemolysin family protein [Spirochaetota bacterium]|nr:hemolysin family protein [Spirochaetota bacterium]HPH01630.1 hemolysin family protein [Spirochaetota bacterium]
MTEYILLFSVLLVLSAFFSGSETAFFSLDMLKRSKLARDERPSAMRASLLLRRPRELIMTVLIGNMLVNTALSSTASDLFGDDTGLAIVAITFTLLIFGEVTPKRLGLRHNDRLVVFSASPLVFIKVLLSPIRNLFSWLMKPMLRRIGADAEPQMLTEDEFKSAIKRSGASGALEKGESGLLANIITFSMLEARHIMTPRTSIQGLPVDAKMKEAFEMVKAMPYSKIPLYKTNKDNIVGYLRAKDLLPYITGIRKQTTLKRLMRPVFRIPEGKLLSDFLPEMQQNTSRLAVVVDEYGGTAGIVTLDDVLEEIMGQLLNENDKDESMYWSKTNRTCVFRGTTPLAIFNKRMGTDFSSDDYQTLSGYVLELAGKIPQENDVFDDGVFRFRVMALKGKHVSQIEVVRK